MQLALSTQLSRFSEQGFCYIPNFLDQTEVEQFQRDFEQAKPLDNGNYHIRHISADVLQQVAPKLRHCAEVLSQDSDIQVDQFSRGVYFPNWKPGRTWVDLEPGQQRFPWHQDHESYFTLQNLTNYLNFYIPIIKPEPAQSNLSLIPLDTLARHVPAVSQKLLGRGAIRVVRDSTQDVILDDNYGGVIARLDFPLTDLAVTPHLQPGDLLLLRGDVLHRTQDVNTQRVAASLRMFNSNALVDRSHLATGGVVKTLMMLANWRSYALRFRYFDSIEADTAPVKEIREYMEDSEPLESQRIDLLFRLLRERWLAGTLLDGLLDLRFLPLILKGIL